MKIILETVVGSTLHGTAVKDGLEDLDLMAIGIEDARRSPLGLEPRDTVTSRTKPEGVRSEAGDVDYVAYGLRKFVKLALKGNQTILLALFAPEPFLRVRTEEGRQLQALAPYIVSKAVFAPFRGYIRQQYERLIGVRGQRNVTRPELVEAYGYDTKYAAHIIRLAAQGAELLSTGRITLPMLEAERAFVVKVRTGGFSFPEVLAEIVQAEQYLVEVMERSPLPEAPNAAWVEAWMIGAYRSAWSEWPV
jgi:hypothetical protein